MYGLKVRWTSLFIFLIAFLIQSKDDNWLNSLKLKTRETATPWNFTVLHTTLPGSFQRSQDDVGLTDI